MVRCLPAPAQARSGSPHPRGDGPAFSDALQSVGPFSPPTWGWSVILLAAHHLIAVLPTHVGMVQVIRATKRMIKKFSPPTWGWSAVTRATPTNGGVLPTHVGMVRYGRILLDSAASSPHPRGDGPQIAQQRHPRLSFSPPTWGWSVFLYQVLATLAVLPTHVGMVRLNNQNWGGCWSSPHPRGDGPQYLLTTSRDLQFSPPTWGWSVDVRPHLRLGDVLPTHVGMVRTLCD